MSNPLNAVGLPKSVNFSDIPPALSDSAKSSFLSLAPSGITQTNVVSLPATSFTANSGTSMGSTAQQNIFFDLPCGGGPSIFYDTSATSLSFRLAWTVSTAGAVGASTSTFMNLISSASSFFDNLTVVSSNTPLESINNYALLHHLLLSSTCNASQRFGNLSVGFGCDTNSNTGIDMPWLATGTYYINFTIPLLSIIGISSMEKLFPSGIINSLQLQMTTTSTPPFATFCNSLTSFTQPAISYILDSFTLNIKQVDLGQLASSMLMSSLREGKIFVKTSTYVNSTPNIPSGASGSQALILQVKNSSVKSIWSMFGSNADYTKNPNGFYDSFCPSINSLYLEVNSIGGRFPNRPLNPINRPSECFNMFAQSIGCSNSQSYNGIISAENYNVCLPSVVAGSDFRMATTGAGVRNAYAGDDITTTTVLANNIVKFPNSFYIGFDLEKISSVLFAGVNTRSAIPTITVNLAQATATSVNVNTWGLLDIVLAFDVASKSVIAYN